MLRNSISFPFIFFVVSIIWQLVFDKEIKWVDNIGIFILMFLILLLYNWLTLSNRKKDSKVK
ncbi:hypothetical protein N780_08735 [Pontibacillus chungwhensis BH030062]|uniref:Uncharacterized protein n=1 Tax=Pontibacillus chungwhensis BH030062 TaxID=1385513 RepID=A0A0A2VCE1_9BACI|nr:hypothetical protein N780_08735 [Pontibacillus chungwhensis BH030062]